MLRRCHQVKPTFPATAPTKSLSHIHGCEGLHLQVHSTTLPFFHSSDLPSFHPSTLPPRQMLNRFSLKALAITDTELKAIAAPAIIGLKSKPVNG